MAQVLIVTILDAGQGDSILLVYPDNSLVLVDCGCRLGTHAKSKNRQTLQEALTRYLQKTNRHLKALVLTHPDDDHYNQLESVAFPLIDSIGTVFYGGLPYQYPHWLEQWVESAREGSFQFQFRTENSSKAITIDSVLGAKYEKTIAKEQSSGGLDKHRERDGPYPSRDGRQKTTRVLKQPGWSGASGLPAVVNSLSYNLGQPGSVEGRIIAANVMGFDKADDSEFKNGNSIVLLLTYDKYNIFLMGDAVEETEKIIVKQARLPLDLHNRKTMIKVGHHGSSKCSRKEWIEYIRPEVAFISSDTKDFSGTSIPELETLQRFETHGQLIADDRNKHHCVYYDPGTNRHTQSDITNKGIFTTLHLLDFDKKAADNFIAYGTAWEYAIVCDNGNSEVFITPSCNWENVNDVKKIEALLRAGAQ